ncbi:4'-phosphopantetheinyl transferase family protein [Dichelobacter nodosus]|uniref:4'-phosphopantetheinyl transferase superfamily domain protein n=1 Tax=Dichelobacter nodosus (strain VCS1703A) TaxID=246195 RepID=A5EY85_DICNV|nr:4'-phosphopantetheinyl transferase superfamily protein [Dichelobacter nodosus]ABQ14242.1 4'-phosphopantetheinyl transferase superfamily domain protein [Dichelobacter nodosus VCS1703A]TGA64538.1 4'-phosphopantetheinyl transferase superfamily protein [Dichelobacter nodosus]
MLDYSVFFATPDCARFYQRAQLSSSDRLRLQHAPQRERTLSWQNSRALKAFVTQKNPEAPWCLSHKYDHAFIALGQKGAVGADLEFMQPRDFHALMKQVCNEKEQDFLQSSPQLMVDFYRLWTLKEALIKAEDLRFPTQMKAVGVAEFAPIWRLKSALNRHYFWLTAVFNRDWIFSALWQECVRDPVCVRFFFENPPVFQAIYSNAPLSLLGQTLTLAP